MISRTIFILSLLIFTCFNHSALAQKSDANTWAKKCLDSMSLDEKIAQLFMIDLPSRYSAKDSTSLHQLLHQYPVGGIIFMKGEATDLVALTKQANQLCSIPLFYAIDGEWGLNMRLKNSIAYPKQMTLGAIKDESLIYEWGRQVGSEMYALGLHINFAPVADVNTNINNPVIGIRSFGDESHAVAQKANLYMQGLQNVGIMAVAKHFPGHGNTSLDSHHALPTITDSIEELKKHLFPFQHLINQGTHGIMAAHISIPALDSSRLPASLSPTICKTLLRDSMHFNGLIFSDALNMAGVTSASKQPAVDAFLAGNDILLMPKNFKEALLQIKKAVQDSIISEQEIDQRCIRILSYKYKYGLSSKRTFPQRNIADITQSNKGKDLCTKLIQESMVLLKNEDQVLPIAPSTQKLALVTIGNYDTKPWVERCNFYSNNTYFHLNSTPDSKTCDHVIKSLKKDSLIVMAIYSTSNHPEKALSPTAKMLLDTLARQAKKIVLVMFTPPYAQQAITPYLKDINGLLLAHHHSEIYQQTASEIIFGGINAQGNLPVSISTELKAGAGQTTESIQLGFASPSSLQLNTDTLKHIDSIVAQAIDKRAIPGCQVLIAHKNKIIWNKAYGYHTYDKKHQVKTSDLYDLASVTKVAATLPAVMHLYDRGIIALEDSLQRWFPEADSTVKEITVKQLLNHTSGLPPFINFFFNCIDSSKKGSKGFYSYKKSSEYPYRITERLYGYKNRVFRENTIYDKPSKSRLKVADNVYVEKEYSRIILDSILHATVQDHEYRYSDLNFIILQEIIQRETNSSLSSWCSKELWNPLGAPSVMFNPLHHFSEKSIAPTEMETFYRKQQIHGYVHDPNAALMGGVAGHAGLFGNAQHLAKYFQMLLNGGTYAGTRFFKEETLQLFTARSGEESRRALGFDKPEPDTTQVSPSAKSCSLSSYGHSGFTGTFAWVDPEYDLIYIFLSNRVYPEIDNKKLYRMNVRTNIQELIYHALPSKIKSGDISINSEK